MSKLPLGLSCVALALGATFGLGACGASGAKESVTPATAEPTPTTVDQALANLDQAEGDINRILGGAPALSGYAQPPGQPAPAEPGVVGGGAAAPPPAPPTAVGSPSKDATKLETEAEPCATACRALASMGRAAEHLCGLAGDSDSRCDVARARVQAATERVHAACPSCSSG